MAIEIKFTDVDSGTALDLIEAYARHRKEPVEFFVRTPSIPVTADDVSEDPEENANHDDVPEDPEDYTAPVVAAIPATAPAAAGVALDKGGLPWDERIHAGTKTTTKDGHWKKKKGVDPAEVTRIETELRWQLSQGSTVPGFQAPAAPAAPAPAAVAPAVAPAAPVAPVAPAAPVVAAPAPVAPAAPVVAAPAVGLDFVTFAMDCNRRMKAGMLTQEGLTAVIKQVTGKEGMPFLQSSPTEELEKVKAVLDATFGA